MHVNACTPSTPRAAARRRVGCRAMRDTARVDDRARRLCCCSAQRLRRLQRRRRRAVAAADEVSRRRVLRDREQADGDGRRPVELRSPERQRRGRVDVEQRAPRPVARLGRRQHGRLARPRERRDGDDVEAALHERLDPDGGVLCTRRQRQSVVLREAAVAEAAGDRDAVRQVNERHVVVVGRGEDGEGGGAEAEDADDERRARVAEVVVADGHDDGLRPVPGRDRRPAVVRARRHAVRVVRAADVEVGVRGVGGVLRVLRRERHLEPLAGDRGRVDREVRVLARVDVAHLRQVEEQTLRRRGAARRRDHVGGVAAVGGAAAVRIHGDVEAAAAVVGVGCRDVHHVVRAARRRARPPVGVLRGDRRRARDVQVRVAGRRLDGDGDVALAAEAVLIVLAHCQRVADRLPVVELHAGAGRRLVRQDHVGGVGEAMHGDEHGVADAAVRGDEARGGDVDRVCAVRRTTRPLVLVVRRVRRRVRRGAAPHEQVRITHGGGNADAERERGRRGRHVEVDILADVGVGQHGEVERQGPCGPGRGHSGSSQGRPCGGGSCCHLVGLASRRHGSYRGQRRDHDEYPRNSHC
mmetsp:Transcript_7907/g.28054  ORF Transcript_7907/g.28054 Transcript_7907/m.28054 type:complete len:583 (+) Transcript_7907:33-1781(+)